MEENALMGLQDEVTICELVVMTAYKNAVPDPYFKIVGQAGVNDSTSALCTHKLSTTSRS
jgi:hypothetical protein